MELAFTIHVGDKTYSYSSLSCELFTKDHTLKDHVHDRVAMTEEEALQFLVEKHNATRPYGRDTIGSKEVLP